jgi:hypothetical protein
MYFIVLASFHRKGEGEGEGKEEGERARERERERERERNVFMVAVTTQMVTICYLERYAQTLHQIIRFDKRLLTFLSTFLMCH